MFKKEKVDGMEELVPVLNFTQTSLRHRRTEYGQIHIAVTNDPTIENKEDGEPQLEVVEVSSSEVQKIDIILSFGSEAALQTFIEYLEDTKNELFPPIPKTDMDGGYR